MPHFNQLRTRDFHMSTALITTMGVVGCFIQDDDEIQRQHSSSVILQPLKYINKQHYATYGALASCALEPVIDKKLRTWSYKRRHISDNTAKVAKS